MKVYGQLESAQLESLSGDPANAPYGRMYFLSTLFLAKIYTSLGWAIVGLNRRSGTRASPNTLTAAGPTLLEDGTHQLHFVKATGGVTISTPLTSGTWIGQQLKIKGTSDVDYVIIPDGMNTTQNGDWFGGAGKTIQYTWDGTDWSEDFRS